MSSEIEIRPRDISIKGYASRHARDQFNETYRRLGFHQDVEVLIDGELLITSRAKARELWMRERGKKR